MKRLLIPALVLLFVGNAVGKTFAQSTVTPATGDSRTVVEPTIPTGCTKIAANKYIVYTNAVNIDGWNSTCTGGTGLGTIGCTGGSDYEPSLTSGTYTAAETADNTTASGGVGVQTALNGSPSNGCVELVPGTSGQYGFVMKPWTMPSGVKLVTDMGITVFASRSPADYGGNTCGTMNVNGSSCGTHWLTTSGTTNSGIYGYGLFDGRGWDKFTTGATTQSFYYQRLYTYCTSHSGTIAGSPLCPSGYTTYAKAYGPNEIELSSDTNFTMYKVTFRNAANFIFNWKGGDGLTLWGIKLIAPFEMSNTDGFDPLNSKNGTFNHGVISSGDNPVAAKATASGVSNITIENSQIGSGVGTGLGTDLRQGISNLLFNNLVMNGNLYDSRQMGLQLISDATNHYGGAVSSITWENICMKNEGKAVSMQIASGDWTTTPTPPSLTKILFRNITVLPSTPPYTIGNSGTFTFSGYSGNPVGVQVDNFDIQGTNQGGTIGYLSVYQGTGQVDSSLNFATHTGVVSAGTPGSSTSYACTNSSWQQLTGELNVQTTTSNFNQAVNFGGSPTSFTLQAMLQPTTAINTKEQPWPTAQVKFYDNCTGALTGCTPIGSASLGVNGMVATLTISSVASGTHNYVAYYPGDSFYSPYQFGSVTVINGTASTPVTAKLTGKMKVTGNALIQ